MIIVSQNKSAIINFEEIETIFLLTIKNKEGIESIQVNARGNYDYSIGEYATEERAKEVLQEIIEHYNELERDVTYAQGDGGFTFNTKFYYEMPEE